MDEEATRVPPASPVTKSRGGDKRRLSESPRSVTSGEKVVPHYLRPSTGSRHDFCKHGKPEGNVSDSKDSRPWRRPVSSSGRDLLSAKESVVTKKTVDVKPKPSPDPQSQSSGEDTMGQEISNTSENIDINAEKASSDSRTDATELLNQEISLDSANVIVTAEDASLDTKDSSVSKKSSNLSKVNRLLSRSPSPIPLGSSVRRSIDGRNSVEGSSTLSKAKPSFRPPSPIPLGSSVQRSIDGRNSVEGSSTLSKAKSPSRSPSPIPLGSSIRRSIDGRRSVEGLSTLSKAKPPSRSPSPIPLGSSIRKSIDGRKSAEGRTSLDGRKVQPSLIPTISKSPSSLLPSSCALSKKNDDNQVANKPSTSKLDEKNIGTSTAISPSSRPSANGEEVSNMKKIRVVRVVSSVRQPSKIIKVVAKVPDDQVLQEDNTAPADTIKIAPEKKSLESVKSKVASSKSTVRSRISHVPSRLKNLPTESERKSTTKDASVLRKSKGVDLKSDNQSTLKARKAPSVGETAQLNRRSVKVRVGTSANAVEKNSSDSFLLRRPSVRRKRNGQVLFNKVIEETANRLVRTSRSKVLALVGAFETVISIQKKSSATPKVRRKGSSRKPSH